MNDREIVQLFWQRAPGAVDAVEEAYGYQLRQLAENLLGPQDAEECVNDAYLTAWNAIPPRRPADLGTYLGKITRNLSIDRLRTLGLRRVRAAQKGKDSILNGIDRIQDYEIIIHPRCKNFIVEIYNYTWAKDKFGRTINKPIDDFNHLMDAMRYALESLRGGGLSILK